MHKNLPPRTERLPYTLKSRLIKSGSDRDEALPIVLFVIHEVGQESAGFSRVFSMLTQGFKWEIRFSEIQ